MNSPVTIRWLTVHQQPRNRIELIAVVESEGPDRSLIAQADADRVAEVAEIERERLVPDVAAVEENHAAEIAVNRRAQFFGEREHAVAADRQSFDERADLVAAPAADAGGAAQEVLLGERHVHLIDADRIDVAELETARDHESIADREIVAAIGREPVVVVGARQQFARLLGVK